MDGEPHYPWAAEFDMAWTTTIASPEEIAQLAREQRDASASDSDSDSDINDGLTWWDPTTMPESPSITILAGRRGGKSWMLKSLFGTLNWREKYALIVVASDSPDLLKEYRGYMGPRTRLLPFDTVKNAARSTKKLEKLWLHLDEKKGRKPTLLVLDDISNCRHLRILGTAYKQARHRDLTCVVLQQRHTALHPEVRGNSDVSLIGRCMTSDLGTVSESYLRVVAGEVQTIPCAMKMLREETMDYQFLVVDDFNVSTHVYRA